MIGGCQGGDEAEVATGILEQEKACGAVWNTVDATNCIRAKTSFTRTAMRREKNANNK